MQEVAKALPSYWLVQASRVGLGGHGWGATGWLVVAAWTVVAAAFARRAYARDTQRVWGSVARLGLGHSSAPP